MNTRKTQALVADFTHALFLGLRLQATHRGLFACLLALPLLFNGVAHAGDLYTGTKTAGGAGHDIGRGVALDGDGNAYVAGHFSQTADFDPGGAGDVQVSLSEDSFLTRINEDGSYGWTKITASTDSSMASGHSVTADGSGNIYVTGYFNGTTDFNPDGAADSRTAAGIDDVFLSKLGSDGSYGWTKTMGGTGASRGYSVIVDGGGNIYVAGAFSGTTDFDPDDVDTDNHTAAGGADIFLTRINSDGSYGWTRTMGGTTTDIDDITLAITMDGSEKVYVASCFSGTADFDPDGAGDNHTSAGLEDIFLTTIGFDASYGWTKTMGGTGDDRGFVVALDGSGNIYVSGYFSETADFDPGVDVDNHTSAGPVDTFLTQLGSDGSYGWTKTMGGTGEVGGFVGVDGSGNIYVTGLFSGTADFDPGAGVDEHTSAGDYDIFLARLNPDGSYNRTVTMGGPAFDGGIALAISSLGDVFIAGAFSGTVDFDPGVGVDEHEWAGGEDDMFVTKFSAGFVVSPLSATTGEDGTTDTFSVKLNVEPSDDVVIDVASSDTTEGTVDKALLTFTTLNWSEAQTVTVTGEDDDIVDGDQPYTIVLTINTGSTADSDFDPLNPPDVAAINMDDDVGGGGGSSGGGCFITTCAQ